MWSRDRETFPWDRLFRDDFQDLGCELEGTAGWSARLVMDRLIEAGKTEPALRESPNKSDHERHRLLMLVLGIVPG